MSDKDNHKKEAIELAEKIYNLDHDAYMASGSALGHVYTDDRDASIEQILQCMETPEVRFQLHQQLALIGNMAHTVENPVERDEILTEYDEAVKAFHDFIDKNGGPTKILDPIIANLNSLSLKNRMSDKHMIICISRSTASGGSHVGINLAEKLNIDYLDSKIIAKMIRTLEITEDLKNVTSNIPKADHPNIDEELLLAKDRSEFRRFLHMRNRYHGLNLRDASFFRMSEILIELSKKQDFVIVGRAADRILTSNRIPHISIFITAPLESRIKRVQAIHNCDARTAKKLLRVDDSIHAKYYNYYSGLKWGDANNYDLCLNSASYGIDGCVDLILNMIRNEEKSH